MKRRLAICTVYAVLIGLVFLSAAAMFRPITGAGGIVANATGMSKGNATWDTVTLFLACKPDTTHADGRWAQDRTAAGTAGKLRLGVNTQFRYDTVAQDDTTEGAFSYSQVRWRTVFPNTADGGALNYDPGAANRWFLLTYVNWQDIIPANSQIISASLKGLVVTGANHTNYGVQDSIMSVLMSAPQDSVWYTPVTGKTIANGCTYNGFANWNWQRWGTDAGASGTRGHPAVSVKRWNPTLISRTQPWNIGEWADLCGRNVAAIAPDSLVTIDITNCVQGAVNGAVNNGIMTYICSNEVASAWYFYLNGFQGTGNLAKQPWFTVKYITKRYQAPYPNGKRWAFTFSTDDQVLKANTAYVDVFRQHKAAYSIFVRKDAVALAHYATYDTLVAWRNKGMEIGTHSRYHWGTWPSGTVFGSGVSAKRYGLNSYFSDGMVVDSYTPRCGLPACTTGYDSLLYDSEPYWLYDGMIAAGAAGAATDQYVGKSMATPGNIFRAEVEHAASYHGYDAVRTGSANYMVVPSGDRPYAFPADFRPAAADTVWMGLLAHDQTKPRNLVWTNLKYAARDFAGPRADTLAEGHLDTCTSSMRRAGYLAAANKTGLVSVMSHDLKGSLTNYYNSATTMLNADELEAMLDGVEAGGGWIARTLDYTRWLQSNAQPIATPTAYAQPDSFNFSAADRQWFVLDGMNGRFVPNLRDLSKAVVGDESAPAAPASVTAYGFDTQVIVYWPASTDLDPVTYLVYRYLDGETAALVGTTNNLYFNDTSVVNGSPYNYYVKSRDNAQNVSAASPEGRATPTLQEDVGRPAYAALWYQNRPDATSLTTSALDSLAAFDALVTWSYPFKTGAANEASMDGLLTNLRNRNSNEVLLTYVIAITPDNDWATYPAGSPERKTWNYCVGLSYAGDDSAGFAANKSGYVAEGDAFDTKIINVCYPAIADTLAKYWAAAFDATDSDGEYAGLFVDVADSTLANHLCDGDDCQDHVDFDADGNEYDADAGDRAAFQTFHVNFIKALRREFAQRAMPNRLLVANTTFGRKLPAYQTANDSTMLGMLDGVLVEGFNELWPGNESVAADWNTAQAQNSLLVHAQTSPPLMLWHAWADSASQEMAEVAALAVDGFACAQNDSDYNGEDAIPYLGDRLPAPGLYSGFTVTSGASEDTLTATWTALKGRMWTERNPVNADSSGAVWPYVAFVPTTHDTLRQSVYWETEGDIGAPAVPTVDSWTIGDGEVFASFWMGESGNFSWLPSDISHFEVEREYKDGDVHLDTLSVAVDDLIPISSEGDSGWEWHNTGLVNGREYKFKLRAVDVLGNASSWSSRVSRTPADWVFPGPVDEISAGGGSGYVNLDWYYPAQPEDFDHFRIWRAGLSGAFALHDSVEISAHQDSTATSGEGYRYAVVAVDDDWNVSAPSDTVAGSWLGTVEPTYPAPSLVRAFADNPSGSTAVVVYPPSDTTGLTHYSIYRGRYASGATDTTACTLYKAGLEPDAFNGCVFYDTHATNGAAADTAFQYTARALYSGHASAKYAVPAWALSTGGISQQTPTCLAYGNGSAISVAVGIVAGCDSTRIFRGTSAATQTLLTTVLATNNPYTDTTALANTDYYYRVRQVASGGTVVTLTSAVSGPVRWVSVPAGNPAISGVTGTIANGQSVVIAGNNFGTKATPAPLQWDTFEEGTAGTRVALDSGTTGYAIVDPDALAVNSSQVGTWGPRYSTEAKHSGANGALLNWIGALPSGFAADSSVRFDSNSIANQFYIDWWFRYLPSTPPSRNLKILHVYGRTGSTPEVAATWFCDPSAWGVWDAYEGGANNHQDAYADLRTGRSSVEGSMHHVQIWARSNSDPSLSDGVAQMWIDGTRVVNDTSYMYRSSTAASVWGQMRIGYYSAKTGNTGCPESGAAQGYIDDLYISDSPARVEIGNNATYSLCTHREIQIPSAWASNGTSITATLNTGTFANGTAYLFVVDSDGNASVGQPITIANP